MSLALSTSWNAFRYESAAGLLEEAIALGFKKFELSFNLDRTMVDEIEAQVKAKKIQVTSLHNYCPIPESLTRKQALPDCYSLASIDESQRQTALKYTKRTIDYAKRLGAQAIVLHCGRIEIPDRTITLIRLYDQGRRDSAAFAEEQKDMASERERLVPAFFENILKSLDEVNQHAKANDIKVGVETRYYFREIPTLDETGIILDKFAGSNLYYWHDTGHAQLMENLGFHKHKEFLDKYSDRMLGIHLHDISGCKDHKAPGTGDLDFSFIAPYLKKETIKVIEAHAPSTAKELVNGTRLLERIFDGKI
ncbi:MAG: sugar phosphate isomerase/epimerase [Candidatus Omnitrophica bacterium]|nr:sugar phosphate isomerase/epimerase [Candidatus Omnitrophota bacterium]